MEITNFDLEPQGKKTHHHALLPGSIRCIITGPSGSGKTNLLLNLLLKRGYLTYNRLHIYSPSLNQEKYRFLQDWAEALEKAAGREVVTFHSSGDDIIPVESLDSRERSVLVFDDVMLEKQGPIEKFFSRGRHGGADCFYLSQSYFCIPKRAIRNNANMVILFSQDTKDLRAIHDSFIRGDMPFDEFRNFYDECTREPHGFCVIDLTSKAYDGKYRCGFDRFYIPKSSI